MSVIITGGSGLIGRALTASLAADNQEVIVLSRTPERITDLPTGAKAVRWDGRTGEGWSSYVNDAKAIVNLAGASIAGGRWTDQRKQVIMDSRIRASQAVIQALEASNTKPDVVVQASAVGYYGVTRQEELNERAEPGNDFLSEVCRDWEASAAPIGDMGIRLVIARTGVVLSLDGGAFPNMVLPFRFFVGGPVGGGSQWFPWIHLVDEVRAIRFLLDKETAPGPYNLVAPETITNAGFSKVLGEVMGRPSLLAAPEFVMKLIFGEMSTLLLDGQNVAPHALLEAGFEFKFPDSESAIRDLMK